MLDEPNASLDVEGEQALERAVLNAKQRGTTILLITHHPSIAAKCDRILVLRDGMIEMFGQAQDVLQKLAEGLAKTAPDPESVTPPQLQSEQAAPQPTASFATVMRAKIN